MENKLKIANKSQNNTISKPQKQTIKKSANIS